MPHREGRHGDHGMGGRPFPGAPRSVLPALGRAAAVLVAALLSQSLFACKQGEPVDPVVARGHMLFAAHCASCHHPHPARDGSVGPALLGSSLELLRARVLHGEYPTGYVPKRATRVMRKLPLTEDDVAALHAFLADAEIKAGLVRPARPARPAEEAASP